MDILRLAYYKIVIGRLKRRRNRLVLAHRAHIKKYRAKIVELEKKQATLTLTFVGSIVSIWSNMEALLDLWVGMIHYEWGRANIQEFLPPTLDRELDYISKAVNGWDFLAPFSEPARAVIEQLHQRKNFRHNLIHGRYNVFDQQDSLKVVLAKVRGAIMKEHVTHYSSEQRLSETKKLITLSQSLNSLVIAIAEAFIEAHDSPR